METSVIVELISTLGFPIAVSVALGVFLYTIYKNMVADNKATIEALQQQSKEREDRLFEEIKANREINGKFADIIAKYEIKLDEIKSDVKEIKADIIEMKQSQD